MPTTLKNIRILEDYGSNFEILTELMNGKDEIQLNSSSGLLRPSFPFQEYL